MKKFKRILCFLLMFVTMGFFVACSKGEPKTPSGDDSEMSQEQGGGSGESSGGNEGGGSGESGTESGGDEDTEDEPQEVYVPYTSNEIMLIGSNFVDGYFDEFEADSTDEDLFDDNIDEMRVLFLNASKMIKKVSEIQGLVFGACMKGAELTLDSYEGKPNAVARFYVNFSQEDANGNSSVRIRILFSYKDLSVDYDYDYYEMLIQTNKAKKIVSCEISVEKSSKKEGLNDSTARYFVAELNGGIDAERNDILANVYQFERTEKIETQTVINYNIIDNFVQSKFDGKTNFYVGGDDADLLLRNDSSSQSILVVQRAGNLSQGLKKISGGVFGTISGLSESLVVYVDAETEIV